MWNRAAFKCEMKIFFVVKRKNTLPKNQQQFKSIIQGNALLEKKEQHLSPSQLSWNPHVPTFSKVLFPTSITPLAKIVHQNQQNKFPLKIAWRNNQIKKSYNQMLQKKTQFGNTCGLIFISSFKSIKLNLKT